MKMIQLISVLASLLLISCGGGNGNGGEPEKPEQKTLQAPSGVCLAADPGSETLEFKWNPVDGAQQYRYRLLKGNTEDKTGTTATPGVAFSGLEPSTGYKFDVAAVSGSVESAWSSRIEARTLAPGVPGMSPEQKYALFRIPASEEDGTVRAFPGAQGSGMLATGGRGGKVIHVTNLEDSGTGSLRAAIDEKGARTIVFDVAGVIALKSRITIKNGDLTIAGQTAPGDGICIKNYNVRINAGNVILRYLRFRMGDEEKTEDDALNCYGSSGFANIIIDHCSLSWSTDECGTFYGVKDFTLQYCILSESLRNSVHDKGKHGYGGIWGGDNVSFHHNLLAHHDSRNPRFDHDGVSTIKGPVHFYNNVVYNWGNNSGYGGESYKDQGVRQINMVNNYYKPGPATAKHRTRIVNPTTVSTTGSAVEIVPGMFYVSGNYVYGSEAVTADNWLGVEPDEESKKESLKAASYQGTAPVMETAEKAFESVLEGAGASKKRDAVDQRIVRETREGTSTYTGSKGSTGGLIDTQTDVGGWPNYVASAEEMAQAADTDRDGMPDWFEDMFALNKTDASDALAKSLDLKGRYTNLEMYLHYILIK